MIRPRIDVRIDELSLRGPGLADGARIASALTRELTRLLAECDRMPGVQNPSGARTHEIRVARGEHPRRIGNQLARVIHDHLTR